MTIASDLFRTITVKINDISQQLPYIVVNQADDNGKIIRFVPMDHGQKVTGFTGARLYYPPRSDDTYGDYVTGVESDGAWDFTIPTGVLNAGRVECNLAFIDGSGETYSRNVVFLVEPAVSGVFDPVDGQQTRLDKIVGTVQTAADTAIGSINQTADSAVASVNKTASDAVESIGKAEESINKSVTDARGSAEAAANSEQQAAASASAAQTSERNAANSAGQASQFATAAKQSETNAAESAQNAASSEQNAASSAEQAANIVASVSGSVTQAETAARAASQSATAAADSASAAGGSAQAAAGNASKAGGSAAAAKASETNAAHSAVQAAQSVTAAAQSASDAQNAVDGFGLQVGTTTTGEPGTDAVVSIAKQGTKYVADFTIPRGEKGEQGVGGTENVLIRTASGTMASANDSYSAPRQIRVHGETIENFWKYNDGKKEDVNISIDGSGLITFSSDTTAMNRYAVFFDFSDEYLEPGKYTIYNWSDDPNIAVGITAGLAGMNSQITGTSNCKPNSSSTFEVVSGNGYRFSVNLESRTVGKAFTSHVRVMIVKGEKVLDKFTPSGVTTAKPEKLAVRTNNFFPNISRRTQNGITLTQDSEGVYHMDGVAVNTERCLWSVWANVPSGDYVFKHSVSRSGIDGFIYIAGSSRTTISLSSVDGAKGSLVDFGGGFWFYIRYDGLQQGVEYHDTLQIVLANGTDIPSDFPNNKYSKVDLPSGLNLVDGDTLVIDSDGSTRITHSSGEPTPSTSVALPVIPAPMFAIYAEGGLTRPTVDVDYERDINIVINKLEQAMAVQAATMKVKQLTN